MQSTEAAKAIAVTRSALFEGVPRLIEEPKRERAPVFLSKPLLHPSGSCPLLSTATATVDFSAYRIYGLNIVILTKAHWPLGAYLRLKNESRQISS